MTPNRLPRRGDLPLPAALLWDMDGTLIDSEPYWIATEYELVAQYGGSWTRQDALAMVGCSLLDGAEVLRSHGVQLGAEQIVDFLLDGVIAQTIAAVPWRPGARELLTAASAAGVPSVLVTSSYRRFADAVLEALPAGSFAGVVTGDEVPRGKPHPDPYAMAAALVGAAPERCVSLEDSANGLASAIAAGTRAVAIPFIVPIPAAPGLSRVGSLSDLSLDRLAQIAAGQVVDLLADS